MEVQGLVKESFKCLEIEDHQVKLKKCIMKIDNTAHRDFTTHGVVIIKKGDIVRTLLL